MSFYTDSLKNNNNNNKTELLSGIPKGESTTDVSSSDSRAVQTNGDEAPKASGTLSPPSQKALLLLHTSRVPASGEETFCAWRRGEELPSGPDLGVTWPPGEQDASGSPLPGQREEQLI